MENKIKYADKLWYIQLGTSRYLNGAIEDTKERRVKMIVGFPRMLL